METSAPTVAETIREMKDALRDYIEATYHIGSTELVHQRRRILEETSAISQSPYIETTPRYTQGLPFAELGLPQAAADLLHSMAHPMPGETQLLFDPPYEHQARALDLSLNESRSLVVTTGTGSGKTESFLLPIVGRLAVEAKERRESFQIPALRAILLYPMNALVNDQLGRLRLMLGDSRVASTFRDWGGRPARFARYTSRTLYPGVRTRKKDQQRLRAIGQFYVRLLEESMSDVESEQRQAELLIANLRTRGKWPAKPNLLDWYGRSGDRWQDRNGNFTRAITLPEDPELLTRHEVLVSPPDILVTNYSMLEYMLMRPLERPLFDATRQWLHEHPEERLLLVIDEAHLYRGAGGAEVGLLIRRLRARLELPANRLQVICTSASFHDPVSAGVFAAQLSGKDLAEFETIAGDLALRPNEAVGGLEEARLLASLSLKEFYEAESEQQRLSVVMPLLESRGVEPSSSTADSLFRALQDFPPMSRLVNLTMKGAQPLEQLGQAVFDVADKRVADEAVTALISLGSVARPRPTDPGLLPCRIHSLFRGLPGLWACVDPACPLIDEDLDGGPVGKLYAQPLDACPCGARVFELYTCRNCGAAYARAYTDDLVEPTYLWSEPGERFLSVSGVVGELQALDLCLEEPIPDLVEPADLDLVTGRLNPWVLGERVRQVFIRRDREGSLAEDEEGNIRPTTGEFRPCGVCNQSGSYGRSSVQDHQTKGDQPFQALITRQIQVQPPGQQAYSDFAPLRGRKVLAFSDSRQVAARLAPNLQTYAMQDVLRPLILTGMRQLEEVELLTASLSLEDLYLAVLLGAATLRVRLRPELRSGESLQAQRDVEAAVRRGELSDPGILLALFTSVRTEVPPQSLLRGLARTITDRFYGLESLALASLAERRPLRSQLLERLPAIPPEISDDEQRVAAVRFWLSQWTRPGIWFTNTPQAWWQTRDGVRSHSGKFAAMKRWLNGPQSRRVFEQQWLPILLETFCEGVAPSQYRIRAIQLSLDTGQGWAYCQTCRTTQRPFPGSARCINCGRERVTAIDPDTDAVFSARKGYYRNSSLLALADPPQPPMAIIAAEHTAQLNAAQAEEVFSKAEEHELLFQDVDLGPTSTGQPRSAIDVLSCTTTMEVGIDIGSLSGVALRNMPPSRASYQQRAGRAGRRGHAVATVTAFGSADSHDEHFFREPDAMIRGRVDDPVLSLDNEQIARRHITAFLLQRYHSVRLPLIDPEEQPQLFEVLGTVEDFKSETSPLNRHDFGNWLRTDESALAQQVDGWLPTELSGEVRTKLLAELIESTIASIDEAISGDEELDGDLEPGSPDGAEGEERGVEAPPEVGEEQTNPRRSTDYLLDRLLYKGVLPRYAFPTDVVAFHVFDRDQSTRYRPVFQYAPSQGLPVALSQYAPGKEVWVDGKLWRSGALYSPMLSDLFRAWHAKRLYLECSVCNYARTEAYGEADRGEVRDCPACGGEATFGRAKNWIRPPGFAHPYTIEEGTSPDDQPAISYATRAKLIAGEPAHESSWEPITPRLRQYFDRTFLLVSNTGPRREGYSLCTRCGLIEPTAIPTGRTVGPHTKPYPDVRRPECPGGAGTRGLVLGTDFISDVLLTSLSVDSPLTLRPGYLATDVVLRTLSEALTIASTSRLGIEAGELQAEYRPALTHLGRDGLEAEIYMYDTLSGGAGFARRVGKLGRAVFEDALLLLESCPAGCDRSCYRCLRSFTNRFEHELLDRYLGAGLLRYLLAGEEPELDKGRIEQACDRLFTDLSRHHVQGVRFSRNAAVDVPGLGRLEAPILAETDHRTFVVGIHGPLTPDYASDESLREAKEFGAAVPVLLLDEIVITRNLPDASRQVMQAVQ